MNFININLNITMIKRLQERLLSASLCLFSLFQVRHSWYQLENCLSS